MPDNLKKAIRDIPDFPKDGIIFKDITPLLADGELFRQAIDIMYRKFKNEEIDKVAAIESRGFIFGSALANRLGAGFIPIRKKGKLPHTTINADYALEYGTSSVEIHSDAVSKGERILLVDDLLATGGTMKASAELIEKLEGEIVGICFLINLTFLKGIEKLTKYKIYSLIEF
ncbi:MAG: adenine phosphoribosyltransferase [Candidatus Aureabacteria bacterium]|nr:adenine phosphoribosyltransferase [Candidatus Auribacterota bacterium]